MSWPRRKQRKRPVKQVVHRTRTWCKPSEDQHTSQNDMTAVPVSPKTTSNTDDTTQDALELDYECCECLRTYQDDVEMGNGAEWMKCACGLIHEECVKSTTTDVNGEVRCWSNCIM